MTSTSEAMACSAQKLSISWVIAMPPIMELANERRPPINDLTLIGSDSGGAPTLTNVPSTAS